MILPAAGRRLEVRGSKPEFLGHSGIEESVGWVVPLCPCALWVLFVAICDQLSMEY